MLDINFIKENKDLVQEAIKNKKGDDVDLDRLLELYENRKELRGELDEVNRGRNEAAKVRDIEKGKALKEEGSQLEEKLKTIEKELVGLLSKIPNIPSPDTPVGPDESANQVIRQEGEKPEFHFTPKPHWELGEALDLIDTERATKVSGARFTYLKGDLALLQFALVNLVFTTLSDKGKLTQIAKEADLDIETTAFVPIVPPMMVKPEVFAAMGRLDPVEDKYFLEKDNMFLVGSAEHSVGSMHMDETFEEADLPKRYIAYSSAFRREAGSYGKDTRGILRLHQFDKLEMETFCLPENSLQEQDFLVAIQEYLMRSLELPYQVVKISTGDMGFPDHRQIDLETWMPGQETYRETHSADLIQGFQPRRLNTKVKRKDGKTEYVHMNDATAFAIGRTLIAIMENYQQEDGSIVVPTVLQDYMGKGKIEA